MLKRKSQTQRILGHSTSPKRTTVRAEQPHQQKLPPEPSDPVQQIGKLLKPIRLPLTLGAILVFAFIVFDLFFASPPLEQNYESPPTDAPSAQNTWLEQQLETLAGEIRETLNQPQQSSPNNLEPLNEFKELLALLPPDSLKRRQYEKVAEELSDAFKTRQKRWLDESYKTLEANVRDAIQKNRYHEAHRAWQEFHKAFAQAEWGDYAAPLNELAQQIERYAATYAEQSTKFAHELFERRQLDEAHDYLLRAKPRVEGTKAAPSLADAIAQLDANIQKLKSEVELAQKPPVETPPKDPKDPEKPKEVTPPSKEPEKPKEETPSSPPPNKSKAELALLKDAESWAKKCAAKSEWKEFRAEWTKGDTLRDQSRDFSSETQAKIKNIALDTAQQYAKRGLDKLRQKSSSASSSANREKLKQELDEVRKEALRIIYDTKVYLTESQGGFGKRNPGQAKVDQAVSKARKLWQSASSELLKATGLDQEVEQLINGISELVESWGGEDQEKAKETEHWFEELSAKLNLQDYATDSAGKALLAFNKQVDEANGKLRGKVDASVFEHIKILNDYRAMLGRPKLFIDLNLCRAAQKHSENCATAKRIWHNGSDGTPSSRTKDAGFRGSGVGENVLAGANNSQAAFDEWYNAADHHRNMLRDQFNVVGVGRDGRFWTQNFGVTKAQPFFKNQ